MQWKGQKTAENDSLLLKPKPNLELLASQFNNATPENNDPENISSSKYYDIDEMHSVEIPNKKKNAHSLNKTFYDLQHRLSCTKNNFDIIGVTETRITK